jgi:hypothetical protein
MDGSFIIFVFAIIGALLFGALCSKIARMKGHTGYGIWGFIFGPIGLLAVAALPDETQRRYLKEIALRLGADNGDAAGDSR